jgi:hypothetical protein
VGAGLVTAAYRGHEPIVRYLSQECGVSASLYGPDALREALEGGHLGVVCLLLEAGTPTDGAALAYAAHCLKYFSSEQVGTILQAATQHGHTQFADMLRQLRAAAK